MIIRIPRIETNAVEGDPSRFTSIWFRFFEQLARSPEPIISTTVGAQTINALSGRFQVAAAATSVIITNNQVTANSIIFAEISSVDATARVNAVVPIAGLFTVFLTAPTAQTSVSFFVAV